MQAAMTALQSVGLIAAALALVSLAGVAVLALLRPRLGEQAFWLLVPLTGLAAVVLVLQNLVYLNVRVGLTAWPLLIASALTVAAAVWRGRAVPAIPVALPFVLAAVIAVHAAGYLTIGASRFLGSGWIDCWNYTITAQFLADYRFDTSLADIDHTPYLAYPLTVKDDRIGQSVLHAAVAAIGRTNAKTAWGATSMLGPILSALALLLLVREHLSGSARWIVPLSATLLPGLGMIHLEDFLSQALAVPLLFAWPVVAGAALEEGRWRDLGLAASWLAAAHACYTEFTPIFAGVLIAIAVLTNVREPAALPARLRRVVVIAVVAAALNPGYLIRSISVMHRSVAPEHPIMMTIYPFAYRVEGLVRLWLGAPLVKLGAAIAAAQAAGAVALTIVAAAGLALWLVKRWSAESIGAALVAGAPIAVLILRGTNYQFYKLMLTASPLLMVGVWMAALQANRRDASPRLLAVLLALILVPTAVSAASLSWRVAHGGSRSMANDITLDAPFDELCARLEATSGRALVISDRWADFRAGWLAYHARRDRVWLEPARIGGLSFSTIAAPMPFLDRSTIPTDAEMLRPSDIGAPADCHAC